MSSVAAQTYLTPEEYLAFERKDYETRIPERTDSRKVRCKLRS